ncbi:MAG: Cna B-type domain-containing protein, partial [Propionibacteriaceae bacterium]|nr:Cna B-type domain-containing protein [Propionibacteriaceae bacterium]
MAKTSYFVFAAALLASTISVSGIQAADARAEAPKLTSASAFIRFDDAADQDGIRPVPYDAQLTLYQQVWSGNSYAAAAPVAGSQKTVRIAEGVSFVSLAGDDGWNDLPEGDDIHPTRYTARLDNVPTGYADPPVYTYNGEYEVPDGNTDTVITLQHNVAITSKTVAITWDDNDSPERPATVELQLLGNGTPVGDPVEVGASTGWSHVFTSLAANYGGHPIDYTVVQTGLTRYETALNPTADGIEIVNTLAASGISWPVYKIWDDDFNRDGIRSAATTLVLEAAQPVGGTVEAPEYGPYEQVGDPLTLTQADCWFRQWTSLPETVTGGPFDGWPIGYRVSETSVPDSYTSTKTDFTVVNSHEIATTSWTLRVEWDDGNDLDALRHSPKFNIFGGKRYYPTLTIPDDELGQNTWEYTWNDLPKYLAGKPLTFTILESYIPLDYAITQTADLHPSDISSSTDHTTIVGYSITNSHEPVTEPTTVGEDQWRAVVLWDDGDDAARVR